MAKPALVAAALAFMLTACGGPGSRSTRHLAPIPPQTLALMAEKGMSPSDPILMRAYKKELELEVWKRRADGKYARLKTFPICRWSGQLGPKIRQGDRQAPEGFYTVTPAQMNPDLANYLAFDTGFPNAYDRAHGRTGAYLMVHGSCSSAGCYAMTDRAIAEIYAMAREAFAGGQPAFQFQAYPFRMRAENFAKHRGDPNIAYWRNLKEGSDIFEVTREEPQVAVTNQRYDFGPEQPAVADKRTADEEKVAKLVARGIPARRIPFDNGAPARLVSLGASPKHDACERRLDRDCPRRCCCPPYRPSLHHPHLRSAPSLNGSVRTPKRAASRARPSRPQRRTSRRIQACRISSPGGASSRGPSRPSSCKRRRNISPSGRSRILPRAGGPCGNNIASS